MPKLEQSKTTIASQEKKQQKQLWVCEFQRVCFFPLIVSSILVEPPLQGGTNPLNQLSLTKRLGHGSQPASQAPARTTWPKCSVLALGLVHLFFWYKKSNLLPPQKRTAGTWRWWCFGKKYLLFHRSIFNFRLLSFWRLFTEWLETENDTVDGRNPAPGYR